MAQETNEIVSLLSEESFQRWLSGKASAEEIKLWNAWLNELPHHHQLYTQAAALWKMSRFQFTPAPDIETEWQKLLRRVESPIAKVATRDSLFAGRKRFGFTPRTGLAWAGWGAVAATTVVVLAVLWRYLPFHVSPAKPEFQIASTEYGQRLEINLPEGSTIILNANSTLRYPAVWTPTTTRQFELQGEAYFEVSPHPEGAQDDFVVRTRDGSVQVVGTEFVVYDRGHGTRVVVEKGGVEVTVADTNSPHKTPLTRALVKPGHLLHFQKGNRDVIPQRVNLGLYTTWWHEQLVLQDTPFEQVIRRLEETYGMPMKVEDKNLLQRTLSGEIENRNLEVVTQALAKALRVTVRHEGRVVIFGDSSPAKRKL